MEILQSIGLTPVALGLATAVFAGLISIKNRDADSKTYFARLPKNAFNGKVVWITGASSGIGESLAYAFAAQGAKLILSSRKRDQLERVKAATGLPADRCMVLPVDLEDLDRIDEVANKALKAFGKIDVLINNAGMSTRALAEDTDFSVYQRITTLDYLAPVALTRAVLPHMLERRDGTICAISSIAGMVGLPLRTAYCGAKFAVKGFHDSLREEVEDRGVKVVTVCPGPVRTNVSHNALDGSGKSFNAPDPVIESGMAPERCAYLTLKAIANNIPTALACSQPMLGFLWLHRNIPFLSNLIGKPRVRKMVTESLKNKQSQGH